MEHKNLENVSSTTLMLPKDNEEKLVVLTPGNGIGKILIREDTIFANIHGCACGKAKFTCSGVKQQWSVLCWGRQSDKKYYTMLVLLSFTFMLSLVGTICFCFTNTISDAILSNMVIRNNSLAYSVWRKPNVHPFMKVHLFNYTNWERYRDGYDKKLHVEDVGPYVYSQQLERVNIEFKGDHLSFQERNHFKFVPKMSVGIPEYEEVNVPNMPLLGLSKVFESNGMNPLTRLPSFFLSPLSSFTDHPNAFVKLPISQFLWGYKDSIFNLAKPLLSLRGELKVNDFGLLAVKNDTLSERLTINTGEVDMDKMNVIEKLDGENHLNAWSGECNSIEATDGSIFPPSQLDRKKTLHVFYPNLCRRLPFLYEKDIETDGIPLIRYRLPSNVFDDPSNNPDNQCFCEVGSGICPPRGVINVTACTMGAPALASFPHFYLGDPGLFKKFSGLNPDPRVHENYLDVHPTLGIALSGKSSLQINMQVRKSNMFSALSFLDHGMILPIAWIEMAVEELPESLRTLIYHGTFSTAAVQLGLAVTSIASLIISGLSLFILLIGRRQKPCAKVKIPIETELKNQQLLS